MNVFQLFFRLGLHHIWAWDAMDHLLFLTVLTIVFSFKQWKKLTALITVFTFTHTVSLFLMAYGLIRINENWVEVAIVWTIILTALTNLLIKDQQRLHRWHLILAFFFGLIHGLGFSSAFMMMATGYASKWGPLLSFAAGIETAQITVVTVLLIVLWLWQKLTGISRREQVKIISYMVLGYSLSLLQARM